MATIIYGKGKRLQSTSVKAFKVKLERNLQDDRIEMPDNERRIHARSSPGRGAPLERYDPGFQGPNVAVTTVKIPASTSAGANSLTVRAATGRRQAATVDIVAPDLASFLSSNKRGGAAS